MNRLELRIARIRRGLTQTYLAAAVGKNQCWLSDVETGKLAPARGDVVRLARALNVDLEILMPDSKARATR
jgi:transcriptional regulator with XRE-family HTH domain